MTQLNNLTGQRFGRLVVVKRMPDNTHKGRAQWECRCDCGKIKKVVGGSLTGGATKSCGCARVDAVVTTGRRNATHGMTKTTEFMTWTSMKKRCLNTKDLAYPRYGGRGITVCDRWLESFENFYEDMGPRPFPGAHIDRIDNDGHYEPDNCRWTDVRTNQNNRRNTPKYEFRGQMLTLAEVSRICGVEPGCLRDRIKRGWTLEDAATIPVRGHA